MTGLAEIKADLIGDPTLAYPDMSLSGNNSFKILRAVYDETKIRFVFIFDEWDCVFKERKDDTEGQKRHLDFL